MGGHHSLIYSVPVTNNKPENETEIYRNWKTPHTLIACPEEGDIENIQDILLYTKSFHGEKPCLGKRNKEGSFEFEDYNTCIEKATCLGTGMINMGLVPEINEYKDYKLRLYGVFSKNSVEYLLLDMASALYGLTSVPIYDTLGPQAGTFIVEQSNFSTLFASQSNIDVFLKFEKKGSIKNVVYFDGCKEEQKKKLEDLGLKVFSFQEIIDNGNAVEKVIDYPEFDPNTIFTFSYTSGTTGNNLF